MGKDVKGREGKYIHCCILAFCDSLTMNCCSSDLSFGESLERSRFWSRPEVESIFRLVVYVIDRHSKGEKVCGVRWCWWMGRIL